MPCYEIDGMIPVVSNDTFIHPSASIIGDVIISKNCYIGPNASLRGDFGRIFISEGSNVQDSCTLHSFPGKDVIIGKNGHIGHGAIIHGCELEENVLVGMNSVIMDGVTIGKDSFVAAMSFIKADTVFAKKKLIAGIPAKIIKELTDMQIKWKTEGTKEYQDLTKRCLESFTEVIPLKKIETNRKRWTGNKFKPLNDSKK